MRMKSKSKLIKVSLTFLGCQSICGFEFWGNWDVDKKGRFRYDIDRCPGVQYYKRQHEEKPYCPVASKLLGLGKQDTLCLESVSRDKGRLTWKSPCLSSGNGTKNKCVKRKALQISLQFCHLGDDLFTGGMGSEHRWSSRTHAPSLL